MITEKLPFSYFLGNHCQGNEFLHENNVAYQSKLALRKWSETDKESSRKVDINLHIFFPIVMMKTKATGSKHIKSYFSGFSITFIVYLSGFYLSLKIVLMTSLNILCSDTHKFF